jgi:hypothetical protein
MTPDADTLDYTREELCSRIAVLTGCIMDFWEDGGWAPLEAAQLLDKSMLRWQASLAKSLARWIDATSEGDLILAWANLGALVEGQLKLFLCVHYNDYRYDVAPIRKRGEKLAEPDGCQLEDLRQFFRRRIWDTGRNWNPYVEMVQQRRNAIHAFKHKNIGTIHDWTEALRLHLSFLRETGRGLPYPDEYSNGLRER